MKYHSDSWSLRLQLFFYNYGLTHAVAKYVLHLREMGHHISHFFVHFLLLNFLRRESFSAHQFYHFVYRLQRIAKISVLFLIFYLDFE